MRYPVVDMDLPLSRPFARRASVVERMHWLRLGALAAMLSLWPAAIFTVSRFL